MSRLFTATKISCARHIVSAFQLILLRNDHPVSIQHSNTSQTSSHGVLRLAGIKLSSSALMNDVRTFRCPSLSY
jgi:hypothetical protein